jgi:transcriptional regulator with XRE-family HTH domain
MAKTRRKHARLDERAALGRRIRTLREERGLTQEALAERAGLQRPVVGYLERGERDFGVSHLWDLAEALDVPVADLFRL